ncbi:MAG: SUMF1/EgtB/PvdO family nonheme iron enzyme [Saprospiraceae bacterium]
MKHLLALPILLFATAALAQKTLHVAHGCAYKTAAEDATLYTFDPSDEALRIVSEICNAVGVSQNFDIRSSNVENAMATNNGSRRVILYSTVFLKKFNEDARTRWAAYSVMAHEIGHHFNGHDFGEPNPGKRKTMELEADRFAGSALRLLGATLDEAKAGIETFALDAEQPFHPSAKGRREALASGWTQQQERLEKMGVGTTINPATGVPRERDTDADGIPDKNDACPEEYGRPLTAGCPDADEDGTPDRDDPCRYLKGPSQWKGCPDSDGDGLPDHEDLCPKEPGYPADKGCPPPDRDHDNVTDRADKCPDTYGQARYQGCPDSDGDGVPDPDDKCPTEKGDPMYNGCTNPQLSESSKLSESSRPDNMAFIQGGTFQMGSSDSEAGSDEKPTHKVTVSSFYLSKYEVTNAEFVKFLNEKGNQTEGGATWANLDGKYNDERCRISQSGSTFKVESGYENYPIIFVSWYGATAYCKWLAAKTGKNYRLPTEAEWEYAARGGSAGQKFAGTDDAAALWQYANFCDSKCGESWADKNQTDGYAYTAPVGSFKANRFGLHDMSGNVWEWCVDTWHSDYKGAPTDGSAWTKDGIENTAVLRGGSWFNIDDYCRSAIRSRLNRNNRVDFSGFRCARAAGGE